MGNFTSGFKELAQKLANAKLETPIAIDNALVETTYSVLADVKDNSPIDTATLEKSWEVEQDNLQLGNSTDNDIHGMSVWASPDIISTNPKYPNGEYYPPLIENGYMLPNGKYYQGRHMLHNAMTPTSNNLKNNLTKELKDVFK